MAQKIPAGWTAYEAGLLVKTDTATDARTRRRRKLSTSQDPLVDFILQGTNRPTKRGHDPFVSTTKQNLQAVIETLRERDPLMFRAADYHDKLPIGTGLKLTSKQPAVKLAAERVWKDNGFDDLQHRMAIELFATGDLFSRVPPAPPKTVPRVDLYPSGQISRIATHQNGDPWYYVRHWESQKYPAPKDGPRLGQPTTMDTPVHMTEDIPAGEIVHVAINGGAKSLRGVSPLESMVKWAMLYGRSLESVWMLSQAKAFLAFHTKLQGSDANDPNVTALRNLIEEQLVTRTDLSGQTYNTIPTGQFLVTSDNVDITPLSATVSAGTIDGELRRIMLMAAVASGTPEVFFSDGDYSNLASSATQSNPFFRLMEAFQTILIEYIRSIFRLAFDRLMAHGVLTGIPLEEGMTHPVDHLAIIGPDMMSPDISKVGPVVQGLVTTKILSRQRAAGLLGEDWEKMKAQILDEKKLGFDPAPGIPGFPGLPAQPGSRPIFQSVPMVRLEDSPPGVVDGEPRHDETFKRMGQARARMAEATKELFEAIAAAGGDSEKLDALVKAWRAKVGEQFADVIAGTREIGVRQAAAEMVAEGEAA